MTSIGIATSGVISIIPTLPQESFHVAKTLNQPHYIIIYTGQNQFQLLLSFISYYFQLSTL